MRCIKGYGFLWLPRKYRNRFLDTGLDAVTTASKR